MLILLPPSEGKASGGDGAPLDLAALTLPALNPTRQRIMDALVALCAGPPQTAMAVLGLGPRQAEDLAVNAAVATAATRSAAELYTGVLYDALGLGTLVPAARAAADRQLLVFSGLWGVLRPGDRVAPYRLPIGVSLPEVGPLAGAWRPALAAALDPGRGLVLDLRSGAYGSAWRPGPALAGRLVQARVLVEAEDGSRKVVSHHNKAAKGKLVRELLTAGADPASVTELGAVLAELGWRAELAAGRGAYTLDLVLDQVLVRA